MRSASARDAMQARLDKAFKQWPTFQDMPTAKQSGRRAVVGGDATAQANYVKALYALCFDSTPIGRDGTAIVGKPVAADADEPKAAPKGLRLKAG